jgi:hypothetical protein
VLNVCHRGPAGISAATIWRIKVASGQAAAKAPSAGLRVPAAEIEQLVTIRARQWLLDSGSIYNSDTAFRPVSAISRASGFAVANGSVPSINILTSGPELRISSGRTRARRATRRLTCSPFRGECGKVCLARQEPTEYRSATGRPSRGETALPPAQTISGSRICASRL